MSISSVSRLLLGAAVVGLVLAAPAGAQSDEQAVIAVVNKFFDGMRGKDTAMIRSTVVPSTVLVSVGGEKGLGDPSPISAFIERVGSRPGPGGDERIKDPVVHIDDGFATLWAYFTYTRGGQTTIDHCGVDLFLLRKSADGWKVFYVADTHRTVGCKPI